MNNLNELKRCIDELEGEPPKNKRHNLKFIIKNSILVHIYYRTIFLYHFHIKYIDIETYDLTWNWQEINWTAHPHKDQISKSTNHQAPQPLGKLTWEFIDIVYDAQSLSHFTQCQ